MAKTAWQCDYGQLGQHHVWEDCQTQQTVIDQATKDSIVANRSVREHNAKLHEMELTWCHKKPGLYPTTFTAIRSCLEAHDAK